jgi:hypothetical protein
VSNADRESGFNQLNEVMTDVAASLSEPGDIADTLERISHAARDTVPGADYASITVRRPDGHLDTLATTDPIAVRLDKIQYELHEGPCYDAVTDADISYCPDLHADARWPAYSPHANSLGLASQMAVRLSVAKGAYTGLNLYSKSRDAFGNGAMSIAALFSSHARVALGFAYELDSLKGAVGTRQVIGQAVGILMERYKLTEERAFEFLIRTSQTSNVKLRAVAGEIVAASAKELSGAS